MHLEIKSHYSVEDVSFRFGGYFLGKDIDRNCFVTLLSGRNRIFTSWLVYDGRVEEILTNADQRKAIRAVLRKKACLQYRLSIEGVNMFRQAYNEIGLSGFCFFEDEQLPVPSSKSVNIDDLIEGFVLDIGKFISVTGRES